MQKDRYSKCFTLVEMLMVMVVITILVGILMPVVGRIRENGRITKARSRIEILQTAILMYKSELGKWPYTGAFPASGNPIVNVTGGDYTDMLELLKGNNARGVVCLKVADQKDPWDNDYFVRINVYGGVFKATDGYHGVHDSGLMVLSAGPDGQIDHDRKNAVNDDNILCNDNPNDGPKF